MIPDVAETSITTGVVGRPWRASISPWGSIHPWDGSPALDWYVAADDRWHVPAQEPSVRQRRVDGTPVTETRLRVPRGDVVHTVYSCADAGGLTVIEVVNESTLPVAIVFDRRDVLVERAIADVPIEGIDLPSGSFVLPLGHRARLRVGLADDPSRIGLLPARIATADQVGRGWTTQTEQASRFVLPEIEGPLIEGVTAARSELLLGDVPDVDLDPAVFCIGVDEVVRMGERPHPWVERLAGAVERLGPVASWESDVALASAARVLARAGERRAVGDVERILSGRAASPARGVAPDDVWCIPWLQLRFASGAGLFPLGLPEIWRGQSIEAHGVPTTTSSTVSLAIRWHGAWPAVLWEQHGPAVELSAPVVAPGWTTGDASGEALWPAPA